MAQRTFIVRVLRQGGSKAQLSFLILANGLSWKKKKNNNGDVIECFWYMWRNLFTNIILTHTPYIFLMSESTPLCGILLEHEFTNQEWLWNITYLINSSSPFNWFRESCFVNITSVIPRVDLTDELRSKLIICSPMNILSHLDE